MRLAPIFATLERMARLVRRLAEPSRCAEHRRPCARICKSSSGADVTRCIVHRRQRQQHRPRRDSTHETRSVVQNPIRSSTPLSNRAEPCKAPPRARRKLRAFIELEWGFSPKLGVSRVLGATFEHAFGRGPWARSEASTQDRHSNPTHWGHQKRTGKTRPRHFELTRREHPRNPLARREIDRDELRSAHE